MPKHRQIAPTIEEDTLRWEISPCCFVNATVGQERVMSIALNSFYLSPGEATAGVESVKLFCAYEGLNIRETFGDLIAVVKAHFNLGTVRYMHMFEKFA